MALLRGATEKLLVGGHFNCEGGGITPQKYISILYDSMQILKNFLVRNQTDNQNAKTMAPAPPPTFPLSCFLPWPSMLYGRGAPQGPKKSPQNIMRSLLVPPQSKLLSYFSFYPNFLIRQICGKKVLSLPF